MAFSASFPVRSLDDISQLEATPLEKCLTVKSTYQIFVNSAEAFGERTALRFLKTAEPGAATIRWSYKTLLQGIHKTANLLHELGVGPDDAVSILLPGCLEYHLALWGGEAAGIVNPLNPLLSNENLTELMIASNTKVLIAYGEDSDSGYWQKALSAMEAVPTLSTVLRVSPWDEDQNQVNIPLSGVLDFAQAISTQPDDRLLSGRQFSAHDTAAYFHTGGTTGSPKLAIHTHGNQVYTAWASVKLQGIGDTDSIINGYPLFHVAGVLPGSLASLSAGVEIIIPTTSLMRNREVIKQYWKLVEYHQITAMSAVPTVLAALAEVPVEDADISSLTYCRTGAAPLPLELCNRFRKMFDLEIHESLGMTEMAGISTITPPGVNAPVGCVGFPLPFSRYKIVALNADGMPGDQVLSEGMTGMILAKSPNVFPGYLNPQATRKAFTDDGWLITGDLGFIDTEGRLNLNGRAKDLIIRSAHNIDPKNIEDALDAHPQVNLSAAVGAPDPYAGELPVAFVTLTSEAGVSAEELLGFAAQRVAEAPAKPKTVTVLDNMPLTNVGKIYKPELRRLAAADAVQQKVESLLQEQNIKTKPVVTAQIDRAGKISVDVTLAVSGSEADQLCAELNKFPVPVSVVIASTSG